jgi:hypothetical protein
MSGLENIERAFSTHMSSIYQRCDCGKEFFVGDPTEDWNDGEFDQLSSNENATALEHWPASLIISGVEYCADCDCWHEKAKSMKLWLDNHANQIAEYLNLEKQRKQMEANVAPVVK